MNAFPYLQLNYCLLNSNKRLDERCLRLIYSGTTSTFQESLHKESSILFYMKNKWALPIKIYRTADNTSQDITYRFLTFMEGIKILSQKTVTQ